MEQVRKVRGVVSAAGLALGLAILLFAWSLVRVPSPAVNENHYLTKARHYWDSTWCAGDLFLESSNPHQVFYQTFGLLTVSGSFPTAAYVGRAIGLLFVAIGWVSLMTALTPRRAVAVVALALFLFLQSLGNFSGEWVVGGIESKVPAYGFLFWGCGCWLRRRRYVAAFFFGLAVSFHPLVGGWGLIAAAGAGTYQWLKTRTPPFDSLRQVVGAAVLFAVAAAPGLIPAVALLSGVDPELATRAAYLQVASRLAHHLDPMAFPQTSYRYFGLQIVIWWLLRQQTPRTDANRWFDAFVLTTLLFAVIGVLIGYGPRPMHQMPGYEWRISLLKFYPFRLADLIVPIAVAIEGARWLCGSSAEGKLPSWRPVAWGTIAVVAMLGFILTTGSSLTASGMPRGRERAWIEACTWIRNETETDAIIFAINERWAVKWFAQRPEYVNYKDCPQDAESLVEWNRRLWEIQHWKTDVMLDGVIRADELRALHEQTGIEYLLSGQLGPIDAVPVYRNPAFHVYELATARPENEATSTAGETE